MDVDVAAVLSSTSAADQAMGMSRAANGNGNGNGNGVGRNEQVGEGDVRDGQGNDFGGTGFERQRRQIEGLAPVSRSSTPGVGIGDGGAVRGRSLVEVRNVVGRRRQRGGIGRAGVSGLGERAWGRWGEEWD